MSEYDYGNARLRVMKSRLLSRQEIESLVEVKSMQGLIATLVHTNYRPSVEIALARNSGMDCIHEALRNDLIETVSKIRLFFREQAAEMISIALQAYDIFNIRSILRGLARHALSGEILNTLLPIGDLDYNLLVEVARAPGPRLAIDWLVSMNIPIARPLLQLRTERPGADIYEMELALEQWRYQEARKNLPGDTHAEKLLLSAIQLDADITNLLTVLRFINTPTERRLLRQRLGTDQLSTLMVGPGKLSPQLLTRAAEQNSLQGAVNTFVGTPYETSLMNGLNSYNRNRRLSDFEKELVHYRLNWQASWIAKDPLDLGVFLGYIALKTNEIANLRWITRGINLGLEPGAILSELFFIQSGSMR